LKSMSVKSVVFDAFPSTGIEGVEERQSARERIALLLDRLIFTATLLLIVLTAIPYGSVEFWWTSLFEVSVFAITMLWMVEALVGDGWRLNRGHWLALPPALLILFSLLQTIPIGGAGAAQQQQGSFWYAVSADPFETWAFALRLTALTLLGMLLLRFTTSRRRLHALVLVVVGVGAASAVFGILRSAMQHDEMGFALPLLPRGIGYGQIISRNQFAFMMEMALGLSLAMLFRRGKGKGETSLFYLALALPIGAALILANSRGGILTMMCQLLFLSLLVLPVKSSSVRETRSQRVPAVWQRRLGSLILRALLIVTLLFAVSAAVVWVGGERVVSNLSTVQEELNPVDEATRWNTSRVEIWRATWSMIKEHPLVGTGIGGYWAAIPRYHDASGAYTPQQAHNDYLELVAGAGVVGFIIALWFMSLLLKRARKIFLQGDGFRRGASLGAMVAMFGVGVHSLFDFGLHITINAALFAAIVVIATAEVRGEAEKELRRA
jgi:O-antigen ligase